MAFIKSCPMCKAEGGLKHCRNPQCTWYCCFKCVVVTKIIYYDIKGRFFIQET